MNFVPLRTRVLEDGTILHVNDTGRFFASSEAYLDRALGNGLTVSETGFLHRAGHRVADNNPLGRQSHAYEVSQRLARAGDLDYLILVPTLRCNLSCSYCQVSRAAIEHPGFDWTSEMLGKVLSFLDGLPTDHIKIEFQGGEPTLRIDLIEAVIARCERFAEKQFVVCTNLHHLSDHHWRLFDNPNLFISTSLDGDLATHARQRTHEATDQFISNLRAVIDRYGPTKVSALPTIDPRNPPIVDDIIDTFAGFGLNRIFLRPINYQGFARKRHSHSRENADSWKSFHRAFVRRLIERNWADRSRVLEETYLGICLRRIFQPGTDRHVDLRNPNPMGVDYLVVDYDGTLYPTDEARMLARSGVVDLSLGMVGDDWRSEKWHELNRHSTNQFDPACERCAFQPYCGRDLVDDIARYGRIDLPRTETAFCRRHQDIFGFIFELIYDPDPAVQYSLSRWLRLDGTPELLGEYIP